MSGDRNPHRGKQRKVWRDWRAGRALRGPGDCQRDFRGYRKANSPPAHPNDGGRMRRVLWKIKPGLAILVMACAFTTSPRQAEAAGEKADASAAASAPA